MSAPACVTVLACVRDMESVRACARACVRASACARLRAHVSARVQAHTRAVPVCFWSRAREGTGEGETGPECVEAGRRTYDIAVFCMLQRRYLVPQSRQRVACTTRSDVCTVTGSDTRSMIILSRGRASGMRRVPRTPATHNLFGHAQSKLFDGPALVLIEALSRHLDPGCAVSHQKNLRPRSQEPQRAAPRSSAHLDAPARSCRRPADDRRQIRTGRSLPASTGSGPLSLFPAPACLLVVSCKRAGRESLRNKR